MVQTLADTDVKIDGHFAVVPIEEIRAAADNPRREVGDVSELAVSIREHGLLQPLLLAEADGGGYTVVAGHRRLAACRMLSMHEVPATVRSMSDDRRIAAALVENLQRVDLCPTEEADAYQTLLDLGVPAVELARRVGRTASHVEGRLSLRTLPEEVRARIDSGDLVLGDALLLTQFADAPEYLVAALEKSEQYGWTVSQAVQAEGRRRKLDEACAAAEATLREKSVRVIEPPPNEGLGTQSSVRLLGKGYGQIGVPRSRHAKQPCHAAFIRSWTGEIAWVCTDPARHGVEVPAARDLKAERAAKRAATRARREAKVQRLAEARELVATMADGPAASAHALRMFLANPEEDAARIGCDLLGIAIGEHTWGEARLALHRLVDEDASAVSRAAFALALAVGEAVACKDYPMAGERRLREHFAFLAAQGHELAEVERTLLAVRETVAADDPDADSDEGTGR